MPELVVDLGSVALPRFYEEPNGHWGVHLRYDYAWREHTVELHSTCLGTLSSVVDTWWQAHDGDALPGMHDPADRADRSGRDSLQRRPFRVRPRVPPAMRRRRRLPHLLARAGWPTGHDER